VSGSPDVIVVGAGIIGAACAWALAEDGHRVIVMDTSIPGGGTTAAGMGHVVVMDDSEAQGDLTIWSRSLWNELAPELPRQVEHDLCGTLWIATDADDLEAAARKAAWCADRGVRAEVLDPVGLNEAEPSLRHGLAGALHVPDDSVVYPPAAAHWLLLRAQVELRTGTEVVEVRNDGITLRSGERVAAGAVVCATGHLALQMVGAGITARLRPRKGHLAITARYPGFLRHQVAELGYLESAHSSGDASVAFNVQPRITGQILIGSSRQFSHTGTGVESPIFGSMLQRATSFLPGLANLDVVRAWTGFRAATDDHLPLIGPVPGQSGLWLATGHEGLGITMSLATGRLIADGIAGRPSPIDPAPYRPDREVGGG